MATPREKTNTRLAFALAILSPILVAIIMGWIRKPDENEKSTNYNQSELRVLNETMRNHETNIRENAKQIEWIRQNLSTKDDLNKAEENIKEMIRGLKKSWP